MTGSAKIAWFIAAVLFFAAVPGKHARCAAPKDALKYLQVTHQSSIKLSENDGSPPGYSDSYRGEWRLDWKPPAIRLSNATSLGYHLQYRQIYIDNLNRITKTSNDSRQDFYKVVLNLKKIQHLKLSYEYNRDDLFQNNYSKSSTTQKLTHFNFTPPRFPDLHFGNTIVTSTGGVGSQVSSAKENSTTWYKAHYGNEAGGFGQDYTYRYQAQTSTNLAGRKAISQFGGYRQFRFDRFGTLQLDYNYSETNKYKDHGNAKDLENNNYYALSLSNQLRGFPLDYSFSFANWNNSVASNDNSTEIKTVNLAYRAPVPEGKQLSITFNRKMQEYVKDASQHTSEDVTNLNWIFRTNRLTDGSLRYSKTNKTDVLEKKFKNENESISGNLRYKIPGNLGELSTHVGHSSNVSQTNRSSKDSYQFNNSFKLGKDASASFNFTQHYDGKGQPRADSTISRFSYNFQRGPIKLNANWQQRMNRPHELRKDVIHNFGVHFTYNTPAKIRYEFMVHEGNTSDTMNLRQNSKSYQAKNEVEFKVTYTF